MTTDTTTSGIELRTGGRWLRDMTELVSSMRFAISLLTVIAIASVAGTVVKQNEPFVNYVNQFGPFWFAIFRELGLYAVYNSAWFLLILAFLVLSTSLCIVRNTPRMLRDMNAWRDHVREDSLRNFGHHGEYASSRSVGELESEASALLARRGFKARTVRHADRNATLVVGKAGTWNRLGYILAHSAIVLICVGGLLDSELILRAQVLLGAKEPVRGDTLIKDIPPSGHLSTANPTFRGNVLVPEGGAVRHAVINYRDRALIQDLPFTIELKKFIVEYYSTGMPKLFASEVLLTDHDTGKTIPATIKVNEPLIHKGIAIYQSSFEDGGSKLTLKAWPMRGAGTAPVTLKGEVGGTLQPDRTGAAAAGATAPTIEFTGFRAINVENTASPEVGVNATTDKRFQENLASVLSSAASATHGNKTRDLKNVGPSVQYKLRDASGQAREFSNYMLPVELDGRRVFLAGMRDSPSEEFRYLRLPADADGSLVEFMRLRAALTDPALRAEAARRYAERALPPDRARESVLRDKLRESALRGLDLFAGAGAAGVPAGTGGFVSIARWIDKTVPQPEQENASNVVMKILSGSIWELWQVARQRAGLKPAESDEFNSGFAHLAANALSDSFLYNAPFLLQLESFDQVQASVFQMTRSPGKNVVFFGSVVLVLGIFAMFWLRERRIWIWIKRAQAGGGAHMLMAMSATRPSIDFDNEYKVVARECAAMAGGQAATSAHPDTRTNQ